MQIQKQPLLQYVYLNTGIKIVNKKINIDSKTTNIYFGQPTEGFILYYFVLTFIMKGKTAIVSKIKQPRQVGRNIP